MPRVADLQQACHMVVLLRSSHEVGLQTTSRKGGLTVQYATHSGHPTSIPHGGRNAVKPRSGLTDDKPQGGRTVQPAAYSGLTINMPHGGLTAVEPRGGLTDTKPQGGLIVQ